jgi:protein TonB
MIAGSRPEPLSEAQADESSRGDLAHALRSSPTSSPESDTLGLGAREGMVDSVPLTSAPVAEVDPPVEEEAAQPERQNPSEAAAERSASRPSRNVQAQPQAPEPVRSAPPSLLPSVSVTRPTGATPQAAGSQLLKALEGDAEGSAPQLQNRETVGQLLADRYPTDLRTRGVGGTTVLTVLVSPTGRVEQSSVVTSSGNPRLDEAAQSVASRMVFRHPQGGSTRDPVWVAVPLTFNPQ